MCASCGDIGAELEEMTVIVGMILAFSDARSGRWIVSAHTPIFLPFFF